MHRRGRAVRTLYLDTPCGLDSPLGRCSYWSLLLTELLHSYGPEQKGKAEQTKAAESMSYCSQPATPVNNIVFRLWLNTSSPLIMIFGCGVQSLRELGAHWISMESECLTALGFLWKSHPVWLKTSVVPPPMPQCQHIEKFYSPAPIVCSCDAHYETALHLFLWHDGVTGTATALQISMGWPKGWIWPIAFSLPSHIFRSMHFSYSFFKRDLSPRFLAA